MSILKSTVAGKSNVPITINWLLANGWVYKDTYEIGSNIGFYTTKIWCDDHYLVVERYLVPDFKELKKVYRYEIYWTYCTDAATYKFPIKTHYDYDKVVKYYQTKNPKERAKIKRKILSDPQVIIDCNMWFSETPKMTIDQMKISFKQVDKFFD